MAWAQLLLRFPPAAEQMDECMPPSKVYSVLPRPGARSELARHGLPKRRRRLVLLAVQKGPPPRESRADTCPPPPSSTARRRGLAGAQIRPSPARDAAAAPRAPEPGARRTSPPPPAPPSPSPDPVASPVLRRLAPPSRRRPVPPFPPPDALAPRRRPPQPRLQVAASPPLRQSSPERERLTPSPPVARLRPRQASGPAALASSAPGPEFPRPDLPVSGDPAPRRASMTSPECSSAASSRIRPGWTRSTGSPIQTGARVPDPSVPHRSVHVFRGEDEFSDIKAGWVPRQARELAAPPSSPPQAVSTMGEAAGGQAEEQAAAPSWPLVHQLDAPSLLAEEWPVVARRHMGDHAVQCTVVGRAI
nr:proline-rich receptor-like protein kinase PERK9 [Aegilops tauschii subsp. strangulata]